MNWLSISPTSGHGNTQITLSATTLTELEDRIAKLIATGSQEGQTLSATTVITQKHLTLTEIYFKNLTWVTDVSYTGGTADKNNCTYTIIAKYSDGSEEDITNKATISGSLAVPATTATARQSVGTLTLTATYEDKTCTGNVEVYQEAPLLSEIFFTNLERTIDISATGGTATSANCSFTIIAKYSNNSTEDITNLANVTGSLFVPFSTERERHSAGTLTLTATYEDKTCTGNVEVYQEAFDPLKEPLTFKITSDGYINWRASKSSIDAAIEYKLNYGDWVKIYSNTGASAPKINVVAGDKIQFRGNNVTHGSSSSYYNTFYGSTAGFEIDGNIMSLINSTDFSALTTLKWAYTFYGLFSGCNGLTSAENLVLPATTLAESCYRRMFYGCSSLTTAPALPAETLASNCYAEMFRECTSLITAPELPATSLVDYCYSAMFENCASLTIAPALPATTLADNCYYAMFLGCTSLTTAPALPATSLTDYCYSSMFGGCTSLTNAPSILPATTLASSCYSGMFQGCTSLTTAPELPAPNLVINCYQNMFYNCSSLNYIKCLGYYITDYNGSNWVYGVASTGTFVKNPEMTSWTTGDSGVPSGWTVIDAT